MMIDGDCDCDDGDDDDDEDDDDGGDVEHHKEPVGGNQDPSRQSLGSLTPTLCHCNLCHC